MLVFWNASWPRYQRIYFLNVVNIQQNILQRFSRFMLLVAFLMTCKQVTCLRFDNDQYYSVVKYAISFLIVFIGFDSMVWLNWKTTKDARRRFDDKPLSLRVRMIKIFMNMFILIGVVLCVLETMAIILSQQSASKIHVSFVELILCYSILGIGVVFRICMLRFVIAHSAVRS